MEDHLPDQNPGLRVSLTPSPSTNCHQPAAHLTDDLLEAMGNPSCHRGVNTPYISLEPKGTSYLISILTSPIFSIEEAVLGGSVGLQENVREISDYGSFLPPYKSSDRGGDEPPHEKVGP
jgi:hypothetical protein